MKTIPLLLGAALSAIGSTLPAQPVQWGLDRGGNGHLYEAVLVTQGISWQQAKTAAEKRGIGWHLATIGSPGENAFIYALIDGKEPFFREDYFNTGPWLGADRGPSGFQWITGEEFAYSNWAPREPFQNQIGFAICFFGFQPQGGPPSSWDDIRQGQLLNGYLAEREDLHVLAGLTHWWPAEGNAFDTVGNAHGQIIGNVAFTPGKIGQAFEFAGEGSIDFGTRVVEVGDFGGDDFSVSLWFLTSSRSRQSILAKRPICNHDSFWNILLWDFGGAALLVELDQDGGGTNYNALYVPDVDFIFDGKLHHLLLAREGAQVSIYLDGILRFSQSSPGAAQIDNSVNLLAGTSVCVGIDGTENFRGKLDEVRIYDRALSPLEVTTLSESSGGPPSFCRNVKFDPLCLSSCGEIEFQLRELDGVTTIDSRRTVGIAGRKGLDIATELCRVFSQNPPEGFGVRETSFGCEFCREDGSEFLIFTKYEGCEAACELKANEINALCGLKIGNQPPSCPDADRDTWCDDVDNCPSIQNPAQWDSDGNGVGDACEEQVAFIRSDVNADGKRDIADPIFLLRSLFFPTVGAGEFFACEDAADANDDGKIDLADGVGILGFLFLGEKPPAPPFPDCGTDPPGDDLMACELFAGC